MHPYKKKPARSFWSTAISDKSFLEFEQVYRKKYEISVTDRIVTAGSCFAQHIAKKLVHSGFSYMNYEPAPPSLPASLHAKYGYDVYSARYANVYTAKQLLQMFGRAFENFQPKENVWESDGRFYDPFRPTIEPDGFGSKDEMLASRVSHMAAVRRVFTESDVFVYTLGLTEAWRSRLDGTVFPVCPGTTCGNFDATLHEFHNYSMAENLSDLTLAIQKARSVNPKLRFLLTVSPVPLTATATEDHVMVATSYSKSVLRAVAGEICANDADIDYFPSYELVAAPPIRGAMFNPNLRTVATKGVDIVMSHFFQQHASSVPEREQVATPGRRVPVVEPPARHIDDVICEEEMLERFA